MVKFLLFQYKYFGFYKYLKFNLAVLKRHSLCPTVMAINNLSLPLSLRARQMLFLHYGSRGMTFFQLLLQILFVYKTCALFSA